LGGHLAFHLLNLVLLFEILMFSPYHFRLYLDWSTQINTIYQEVKQRNPSLCNEAFLLYLLSLSLNYNMHF
jgi:hypothetical protein